MPGLENSNLRLLQPGGQENPLRFGLCHLLRLPVSCVDCASYQRHTQEPNPTCTGCLSALRAVNATGWGHKSLGIMLKSPFLLSPYFRCSWADARVLGRNLCSDFFGPKLPTPSCLFPRTANESHPREAQELL